MTLVNHKNNHVVLVRMYATTLESFSPLTIKLKVDVRGSLVFSNLVSCK